MEQVSQSRNEVNTQKKAGREVSQGKTWACSSWSHRLQWPRSPDTNFESLARHASFSTNGNAGHQAFREEKFMMRIKLFTAGVIILLWSSLYVAPVLSRREDDDDAGPGGDGGGASWGMTTDGERVFTNILNNLAKNFTLSPSSTVITWGVWIAMNASTGAVLWSTANPAQLTTISPVSHANGVVFGASTGNSSGTPQGQIVALDAISGTVLWEYTTPGGLGGGVSILDGCIFQPIGGSLLTFGIFNVSRSIHGHSTISLRVP